MPWSTKRNLWQQDIERGEYIRAILKVSIMSVCIAYLFYENVWAVILATPFLLPYIRYWETQQEQKLRGEFQIQLRDYLQALGAALSTGYALENAMREARKDLSKQYPAQARIIRDTKMLEHLLDLNMPVEQVWKEWAEQIDMEVLSRFVTVFIVSKRSGGDSLGIIKNAIGNICDIIDVEGEIQVVLSGKRMEFQVMSLIPLGMLCYMKWSFGDFMGVLYGNLLGAILMTICLGVYGAAIVWGNKIIQIEV